MTTRENEPAGGVFPAMLVPTPHPVSPADGLQGLQPIAVDPVGTRLPETAGANEQTLTLLETLVADPDVAAMRPASRAQAGDGRDTGRAARRGRHAAPPPPYLERRAARFVLFSAIGGFIFLMGLGLQAALTGTWHVQPLVSYAVQAVVSVETSFLLNRWLTWRDRNIPFGLAFARFNIQKTVTVALNLALYAGLLRVGINYLVVYSGQLCCGRPPRVHTWPDAIQRACRRCHLSADFGPPPARRQCRHPVPGK